MTDNPTLDQIALLIDHSLLHPTLTDEEMRTGCALAARYKVATVCVKPYAAAEARQALAGSPVGVCSVIGFPHGNSATEIKVAETERAIRDGSTEIDMVINVGKALGAAWDYVGAEIEAIHDACRSQGAILKVIFETDYLEDGQIIRLCGICSRIRVEFVKTSSGYGFVKQPNGFYAYAGATVHNLELMRRHCDPSVQLKAAGGVRTLDDLLRVRAAGATRVGATATETILEEAHRRGF